jgi:sec-independent protein translocase protein TatA
MPFNLGPLELLIILVIIIIIFGVGRLPEVGGAIGKGLREFRRATADLNEEESEEKEKQG